MSPRQNPEEASNQSHLVKHLCFGALGQKKMTSSSGLLEPQELALLECCD